jgi:sulfatase modifying factor 1
MRRQPQLVPVLLLLIEVAIGQNQPFRKQSHLVDTMTFIHGGTYLPFSKESSENGKIEIKPFYLDDAPVTNAEYLQFVEANPSWRKSKVKPIFADANYLKNWNGDLTLGENAPPNEAVTYVSWFAALAYCKWVGKRLPTTDEWEYAIKIKRKHRITFSKTMREWTEDFDSVLLYSTQTDDGNSPSILSCGGASVNVNDPKDYSAFLRYSFRSSLKPNYCLKNLGFRCAITIKSGKGPFENANRHHQ